MRSIKSALLLLAVAFGASLAFIQIVDAVSPHQTESDTSKRALKPTPMVNFISLSEFKGRRTQYLIGGISWAVHVFPPTTKGPTKANILFLHGFPDFSWSWRKQINAVRAAGYQAVVVDLPGYGYSTIAEKALSVEQIYGSKQLSSNLVKIMSRVQKTPLEQTKFFVVGHDFGGNYAWRLALNQKDNLLGVVSVATPYFIALDNIKSLEDFVTTFGQQLGYMLYFARNSGKAAKELNSNTKKLISAVHRSGGSNIKGAISKEGPWISHLAKLKPFYDPKILGSRDVKFYLEAFGKQGFIHMMKPYAMLDRNFDEEKKAYSSMAARVITHDHAMFIGCLQDPILTPGLAESIKKVVPKVQINNVDGSHFCHVQNPGAVNKALIEFFNAALTPKKI